MRIEIENTLAFSIVFGLIYAEDYTIKGFMSKLCIKCGGTGQYLGTGMMLIYCDCDDAVAEKKAPSLDKIDRKSAAYQKAIKNLMKTDPKLTREKAIKLFNETYNKV